MHGDNTNNRIMRSERRERADLTTHDSHDFLLHCAMHYRWIYPLSKLGLGHGTQPKTPTHTCISEQKHIPSEWREGS